MPYAHVQKNNSWHSFSSFTPSRTTWVFSTTYWSGTLSAVKIAQLLLCAQLYQEMGLWCDRTGSVHLSIQQDAPGLEGREGRYTHQFQQQATINKSLHYTLSCQHEVLKLQLANSESVMSRTRITRQRSGARNCSRLARSVKA